MEEENDFSNCLHQCDQLFALLVSPILGLDMTDPALMFDMTMDLYPSDEDNKENIPPFDFSTNSDD